MIGQDALIQLLCKHEFFTGGDATTWKSNWSAATAQHKAVGARVVGHTAVSCTRRPKTAVYLELPIADAEMSLHLICKQLFAHSDNCHSCILSAELPTFGTCISTVPCLAQTKEDFENPQEFTVVLDTATLQ
jgi:hypothetical protein